MKTPYFTLLERDRGSHVWAIAFGDYSRRVVEAEMRDMKDRARFDRTGAEYRIITTDDDTQEAINAAVSLVNQLAVNEVIAQKGTIR